MSERDDQSIDHELSGVAMAALHQHELTVSANETEAALEAVRSRAAAGDLGGAPPSIPLTRATGGRRPPWVRFSAVAAAVSMVVLGLVAVTGGGSSTDIVTQATVPQTVDPDVTTQPSPTMAPETEVSATTTTSTIEAESTFERQVIGVDALDPPRLVEPVPYFSLPLEPNVDGNRIQFAVGIDHVVVNQPNTGTVTIVGPSESGIAARTLAVEEDISEIVSGPGPVIYGFGEPAFDEDNEAVPRGFRFVAIPFLGENEGKVVAVDEVGLNEYLEIPPYFFGHGPDGVIARGRDRATVIGYVDEDGQPRDSGESTDFGTPFPLFEPADEDEFVDDDIIELAGTDVSWQLDVARDPDWVSTYVGRNVVVPGAGRAIYAERIGADTTPDSDFGENAMPVVALLNYDGSGEWIRLPDDWDVVASDVWGTLLARITDDSVELAFLDDLVPPTGPPAPAGPAPAGPGPVESTPTADPFDPPTDTPTTMVLLAEPSALVQPTAIDRTCVSDVDCTQLAIAESGPIVALAPASTALFVYDPTGTELRSEVVITEPIDGASLQAIGPDEVAYIRTFPRGNGESGGELLAIPLVGSNAGTVVMRWTGLDVSGDNTLIPRRTGLTSVGCCGPKVTRPTPDATIFRWVDRNGSTIESTAPSFDLNLGEAGNSLTRIDRQPDGSASFTRFGLPTAFQYPRDFPYVVATDEGGALAYDFVQLGGSYEVFVDFSPAALDIGDSPDGLSNGRVYYNRVSDSIALSVFEPAGTMIVVEGPNGGQFVRRTLDEIATRGWPGEFGTDGTDQGNGLGATFAEGLNDYIAAEQPFWADEPELFALQLTARIGPNESVSIEYDDVEPPTITITTSGFLDDSVEGSQRIITTRRGSDGLLRFVSGTYGFRCQPGRGHQDYSVEPCN